MSADEYVTFDPRIPKYTPVITRAIISLIIVMYIVEIFFNALYSEKAIILLGAKWNEGITQGEYWRFITPVLLHGNLIHLLLNVIALNIFANELESIYGTLRFLLIFLLSSWGATLTSYAFSTGIAIGASGALFGIIGGLIIFFFRQREKVTGATMKFKAMYTLVIINLLLGLFLPRIDNSAHLGGLITGLTVGWFISPEYHVEKDEQHEKLLIVKKADKNRVLSGLILIITILFWLTNLTINTYLSSGS